ncbi:internal virion protein [Ralstonia phage RSB2]|uniref:Putative internal virion protein C n=1 Tax=Ralstonia phage RSB2 TaxID=913183 RepID=E5RV24_9CAUD|nr:internal virion protein [Ralstonia phage RSB2]BAJ51832.1 putative internal virion protein C [Ralstonia phage RSB2]
MAANNAYMLWRQFSGQPRVSKGIEGPGYRAQGQERTVDLSGPSVASRLADFANTATQAFVGFQKQQYQEADEKVQAFMKDKTVDEYRQAMKDGNVPFQDDTVAMSVLHNKAAYTSALQVEQDVEDQIQQGKFKDFNEADEYRVKALNNARKQYAGQFGVTEDNPAFNAGFDRDQERRRETLLRLQTNVTNKRLAQEAMMVAKTDMVAPLPEVLQGFGAEGAAKYIVFQATQADKTGLARSDADKLALVQHGIESIVDLKGGADVLERLGAEELEIGGTKAKLRDLMGGGKFDLAVTKARTAEFERDGQAFVQQEANYTDWISKRDSASASKNLETVLAANKGQRTPQVERASAVLSHIKRLEEHDAQVQATALAKAQEDAVRQRGAIQTLGGILAGSITGGVDTSPEGLGLKNRDELVQVERTILDNIPDGPQKDQAILKLATTVPNGYAFKAVKGIVDGAEMDWEVMQSQINSGNKDVKVPGSVERAIALTKIEPTALLAANGGKQPSFMKAVESAARIGFTPAQVAQSQAAWKALPEKERTAKIASLSKTPTFAKTGLPLTASNVETLQTSAGVYMSLGLDPDSAMRMADQDFRDQNVVFPNKAGAVHKSFFQFDGSRTTFDAGKATFDTILGETTKGWGVDTDRAFVDYDPQAQVARVRNVMTGETRVVTQQDLRALYEKGAKAAGEAQLKETKKTIQKESQRQKKRSEITPDDIAAAAGVGTVR